MKRIGGNTTAQLQTPTTTRNAIGEMTAEWRTAKTLTGFLDLQSGEAKYSSFNAKIQESTHVFVCDYVDLGGITAEGSRLVVGDDVYDVTLIDDPMGLHRHLEIFLTYRGGQSNG